MFRRIVPQADVAHSSYVSSRSMMGSQPSSDSSQHNHNPYSPLHIPHSLWNDLRHDYNYDDYYGHFLLHPDHDNASRQCSCSVSEADTKASDSTTAVVVWVLRWTKRMVWKLSSRPYAYAYGDSGSDSALLQPMVVLMAMAVLPFVLGLWIGFIWGRRTRAKTRTKRKTSTAAAAATMTKNESTAATTRKNNTSAAAAASATTDTTVTSSSSLFSSFSFSSSDFESWPRLCTLGRLVTPYLYSILTRAWLWVQPLNPPIAIAITTTNPSTTTTTTSSNLPIRSSSSTSSSSKTPRTLLKRKETEENHNIHKKKEYGGWTSAETSSSSESHNDFPKLDDDEDTKEKQARRDLRSREETTRESAVPYACIPQHVAVIMDGNRRYGRATYGRNNNENEEEEEERTTGTSTSRARKSRVNDHHGHWDGSRTLLQMAKWCLAEHIPMLTVYAFSTENWRRDPHEVADLMHLFVTYCEELRVEALQRNIRITILSSDAARIPPHVQAGLDQLQRDTHQFCTAGTRDDDRVRLQMNICLSYGSRGEMVHAAQQLAQQVRAQTLHPHEIDEEVFAQALLTHPCPDPDVLIRTSGEYRLSNFLLWQLAYTELFFVPKHWPEFQKSDLLQVIESYATNRSRRYGK